jgi:MinD-like ATPase involved in chromosome partitioning or flagellar assembly
VMIPSSRLVPLSLNRGKPVYVAEPRSSVAKAFDVLADKVLPLNPRFQAAKEEAPRERGKK